MMKKVILVWFRNDLRIHDNEILFEATTKGDIVIPVFFFDPRYFKRNKFGFLNTGLRRADFLIQSVQNLKINLQKIGADLLTFHGKPEDIIPTLCAKYDISEVYHHREVASRETNISEIVETALWSAKINLKHFIGHTLYHKEDLPIPIKDIPDAFTAFRKKVEKESFVRPILPAVTSIVTHPHLEKTTIPTLLELGFDDNDVEKLEKDKNALLLGGETKAIQQVNKTLDDNYTEINNYNLITPYIAHGNISPAYYHDCIKKTFNVSNKKKHETLTLRLLWRDYFRFMLKKYPNIFFKNHDNKYDIDTSIETLKNFIANGSDNSIINQLLDSMIKLGNMPYEYREILAAYIHQELKVNHLVGAAFFEEYLIDYVPATTYGYWLHYAGSGTSLKNNLKDTWQELVKRNYKGEVVEK